MRTPRLQKTRRRTFSLFSLYLYTLYAIHARRYHLFHTPMQTGREHSPLPPLALITYLVAPPSAKRRAACKPRLADIDVSL